jgi:Putative zinc-finger
MTCKDWLLLIEEAIDEEVSPRDFSRLHEHLAHCPACASQYRAMQRETELFARYERGLGSASKIWDGVETRIRKERFGRHFTFGRISRWLAPSLGVPHFSPVLTVALVLISIAGTVVVMKYRDLHSPTKVDNIALSSRGPQAANSSELPAGTKIEGSGAAVKSPEEQHYFEPLKRVEKNRKAVQLASAAGGPRGKKTAEAQLDVEQLVREAENKYLTAITILSKDIRRRSSRLDPSVRIQFEGTLAIIDHSIEEARLAARKHPADPVAVQYLLTAYAKKVEVLKELASL